MELPVINEIKPDIKNLSIYLRSIKKFGKTTLFRDVIVAKYGDPSYGLLVQCGFEKGTRMLDNINTLRITSYEDAVELKEYLINKRVFKRDKSGKIVRNEKRKPEYVPVKHNIQMVCFDTVDEICPLFEEETIRISNKEGQKKCKTINAAMGGYQAGQRYTADMIKAYMSDIEDAGIGVWGIAHTKFKTIREKGGLEEDGYQQLTSNLVSAYESAFGDIFDVTFTGVIDRNVEVRGEGDKAKRYATDEIRKLYFRGTTLIDAGGRFASDAVPEYMVFDKGNMGEDFIEVVEDGMEKSKTVLSKKTKKPTPQPEPEDEIEEDIDDVIEDDITEADEDLMEDIVDDIDEDTSDDYPEDLREHVKELCKTCEDAELKTKVKGIIKQYGKLSEVDDDGLKEMYDLLK
jgi:hypothetical protein